MKDDFFLELRKFLVPEIVYGEGALTLAGRHASNFGAAKVLVVTDPGIEAAGLVNQLVLNLKSSNVPHAIYNNVSSNPKDYEVMEGVQVYRSQGCDLIIAIGGGSPMDCAKGIGVVIGNEGGVLDYVGVNEITHPGPPMIFIPTTAGSSADVSQFAIITDTFQKVKKAIVSKMVIPDIALIDPATTVSMPPDLTAASGMDAICHAFEAYVSTASSALTDMAASKAVSLAFRSLKKAFNEPANLLARNDMMMASLMAGIAFSNASLGLVHGMAHALGGRYDLPHGECNAILMEKVIKFNYRSVSDKYDELAAAFGLNFKNQKGSKRIEKLVNAIQELREELDINIRLVDMGVERSDLSDLAQKAYEDPCLATNPKDVTVEEIESIYGEIFE